jgi:hypothetical protein
MRACKLSATIFVIILFCLTICASFSTNIWLSKWADTSNGTTLKNSTSSNHQIHDMIIYSALGIAQGNKMRFVDLFEFVILISKVF